ncbi:MAG: MJ1477/TM1410 family putative glycoside hydrolase [Promethearchaeota archaeon]
MVIGGGSSFLYLYGYIGEKPDYNPSPETILGISVSDFGYLLQYDNFESQQSLITDLSTSEYDLLILEAFLNQNEMFSKENMIKIQSDGHSKLTLAYMSIGEAESYRYYWNSQWDADSDGIPDDNAPSWLDRENPDWEGNYKVKYWDPEWQNLIFGNNDSYLDQIIAAGFNGTYLDIIDAYEYYEDQGVLNAAKAMVNFITNISSYAKTINPNFLIVPQNGENLGVRFPEYLDSIDGIGREDILFAGDKPNSKDTINTVISDLQVFQSAGKFILEVEYPIIPRFQYQCFFRSQSEQFLCYIGPRDLAELNAIPDFIPINS